MRVVDMHLAVGPCKLRRADDNCRFCRERALVHGHARWCGKEALFQQLVRYCEFELPEAWDPVRHVVLLSLHVVARVLEESAGQGAGRCCLGRWRCHIATLARRVRQ